MFFVSNCEWWKTNGGKTLEILWTIVFIRLQKIVLRNYKTQL